jgi:hypothetical protein
VIQPELGRPEGKPQSLLCSVLFEELSDLLKSEGVSVDDELVFAGVVRNRDDAADTVAVLAEGLENEVDVSHG